MSTRSRNKIISINELWQFFNSSATLFCISGADGYLKQVNPYVMELLGFSEEEMLSVPFIEFVHADDRETTHKQSTEVRKGLKVSQITNRILTVGGDHKWICWTATYIGSENNVYLIGQDHSERYEIAKKLEQEKQGRQKSILEASLLAQEKERAEIGRELHDNINQMLASVLFYQQMALDETEHREQMLIKSSGIVRQVIEEIRSLSKALVGPDMKNVSLSTSVRDLIDLTTKATGIAIIFNRSGKIEKLPPKMKLMLFRIIQEQLNNIVKHAQAKNVSLRIITDNKGLSLDIVDNGKGFDKKKKRNGIGLSNMLSRVELCNGSMQIESSPGKGCALYVHIPEAMLHA